MPVLLHKCFMKPSNWTHSALSVLSVHVPVFLTTPFTYPSSWQDFGGKKWQQTKPRNKSSVSILADIVVDTHAHTHTLTQMYTLTLLAGFTTPCILLGLVLAGKLKDSLKDHLMDEAQRTCAGTRTDTSTPLFLVLSKACFVFSPADEGRWAARLKYFTVLDDRCKGWQGFIYLHIFQTALLLCPCTWLQPVVNTCYEGTEKERRETTSDAWVYTDTRHKDSNVNRYECIFFSLKHYHCSNEDHVEMLVTEEQGGSGLNKKRCILEITQDNNFVFLQIIFYWNSDGSSNFTPMFLQQCLLWLDDC